MRAGGHDRARLAAWRVTCALLRLPACLPACLPRASTLPKKASSCALKRTKRPKICFVNVVFLFVFSARKGNGTDMSERLRRAAEDLKRMQTEYEELQAQAHCERGERSPSAPLGTTAQPTNDHHTSEAAGHFSCHTAASSLHHRPSSFRPGHRNSQHDYTSYFERRQQPSPGFQRGGREHREEWETNKQPIEQSSTMRPSTSGEETQ